MEKDVEIGIVRASCNTLGGEELYWLFSRKQFEFVVKELEIVDTPTGRKGAYMKTRLPLVSLENHYGYVNTFESSEGLRYMVLRAVDKSGGVHRVIVECNGSPRFFRLANSFASLENFNVPANDQHYHGAYEIGAGKVVIVPDIVEISNAQAEAA